MSHNFYRGKQRPQDMEGSRPGDINLFDVAKKWTKRERLDDD